MVTYANILPTPPTDGAPYATAAAVPATEADLGAPLGVPYEQAAVAVVQLTIAGGPASNTMYVVMQGDMGDGVWIDLAWLVSTSTTNGTLTFLLAAGGFNGNAVAQTRANGTAPGSSGSINCPPLGRIRFTGQATLTGGSTPTVKATIKVKLLGLR